MKQKAARLSEGSGPTAVFVLNRLRRTRTTGIRSTGLICKGPKTLFMFVFGKLCLYLFCFVFFVFICLFLFLFVFICFCLSFICNCLLLFYLGPGFVLYVYNTSPRPQSALV